MHMSTLVEIETAIPQLGESELFQLEHFVHALRMKRARSVQTSALDLPPLNLGQVRSTLSAQDDLLEEMLNDPRD